MLSHNQYIEMYNCIHQLEVELLIQLWDHHMRFAGDWGTYHEATPIKMGYQQ